MIIYLSCFLLSCFFFWLGQSSGEHPKMRFTCNLIALLIPSLVAGVRDISVGTDIGFYVYPVFQDAITSPSPDKMLPQWDGWIDYGYLFLSFWASKVLPNFHYFLFLITLFECFLVFSSLNYWKKSFPIWLGMFCFFAFFFNESLSTMRQCLAMSIVFFAIPNIFEKRIGRFILYVLFAGLFHKSAWLALGYIPLFLYSLRYPTHFAKALLVGSVIAFFVSLGTLISTFLPQLDALASVANRAAGYFNQDDGGRVPYKIFIYFTLILLAFMNNWERHLKEYGEKAHFFVVMFILIVFSQLLPMIGGEFVFRFSFAFTWWLVIVLPITFTSYVQSRSSKLVVSTAAVFYCLFYWYSNFIHFKQGGTQIYTSRIMSSIL